MTKLGKIPPFLNFVHFPLDNHHIEGSSRVLNSSLFVTFSIATITEVSMVLISLYFPTLFNWMVLTPWGFLNLLTYIGLN